MRPGWQCRFQFVASWTSRAWLCGALLFGAVVTANAQSLRVGGTGSALGTMQLLGEDHARKNPGKFAIAVVPNLGSSGALKALRSGAIDIAVISRKLKPEEVAAGLVGFEYGRSPFVFVTSKAGVRNITPMTAANALSGRSGGWPDGQPVRFVLRPESDGDSMYLASFAPDIAAALKIAHKRAGMVVAVTDQEAADEAERLPGSLAVNTLALILSERRKLTVIPFNGVTPSVQALAAGSYPYFKPFLIVTQGAPSSAAMQFIEFVKSPQGRAVLEANGHHVSP